MIVFKKLSLKNFLSFSSQDLNLDRRGIVLLYGKNGHGKSAIFEGINWCLFGKTSRNISIDKIGNRYTDGDCCVSLVLSVEGKDWEIQRFRTKAKETRIIIRQGKEVIDFPSIREGQKFVEDLISCNYEVFNSAILLNQSVYNSFSSATDKGKKELIEDILGLWVFSESLEKVKSKMNRLRLFESRFSGREKNYLERKIALESRIKEEKNKEKVNREEYQLRLEKLEEELKGVQADIDNCKDRLLCVVKEKNDILQKLEILNKDVLQLEKNIEGWNRELTELEKLWESSSSVCDKCGSLLTEETKKIYNATLSSMMNKLRVNIQEGLFKKEEIVTLLADLQDRKKQYDEDEEGKLRKILSLKERERDRLFEEITLLRGKLDFSLSEVVNLLVLELEEVKKNLVFIRNRLEKIKILISYYAFWVKGFGQEGVKNLIFEDVLKMMEIESNKFSKILTDGKIRMNFSTSFELKTGEERNRFNISIWNLEGGSDYNSLSEGEKRRADLCLILSLQKIMQLRSNNKFNVIFFDEIFESLDSEGVQKIKEILKLMDFETCLIITHREDLVNEFENSWRVLKKNKISTVVEDIRH